MELTVKFWNLHNSTSMFSKPNHVWISLFLKNPDILVTWNIGKHEKSWEEWWKGFYAISPTVLAVGFTEPYLLQHH